MQMSGEKFGHGRMNISVVAVGKKNSQKMIFFPIFLK